MKKKIIIGIIAIVIITIGFLVFSVFYYKSTHRFVIKDLVALSIDQLDLVNSFGYPDVFLLSMDDEHRFENWTYYNIERTFSFLDGEFVKVAITENIGDKFQFPKFRPTQFKEGSSLDDISKVLGNPLAKGRVSEEIMENTYIYDYWDQVKVGVKNDKIIFVQTLPVLIPEEFRVEQ